MRGDLAPLSTRPVAGGGTIVRLQQLVDGVPVMGGEVVVDLDPAGRTRAANAESLADAAPSTVPSVAAAVARTAALAVVAKHHGLAPEDLRGSVPTLAIFDPRIFGADGVQRSSLVWRVDVTSSTDVGVRRLVLVDASRGTITLDLDQLATALSREVCDARRTAEPVPCTHALAVRSEGEAAVGPATDDVNRAYDLAGVTYGYFRTVLGRDSVDGSGLPLRSTVRYCPTQAGADCPFDNAFWDGTQMVYGEGYTVADDVVAHELTHGVTQYESNLYYLFQSGAINESLSDIFGELVDLANVQAGDTPAARWLIGEDLPTGAIRDMQNPAAFGQPDRTGSGLYQTHRYSDADFDSGGVHTNSGVGNKFAYLLTDGDSFNGRTVTGIGPAKAALVVYRASQLLTSGADYRAFATALRTACATLASGSSGVVAADCVQVNTALLAVQMDSTPARAPLPAVPSVCPAGTVTQTRFSDPFERTPVRPRWLATGSRFTWRTSTGAARSGPLWFYGSDRQNPYLAPQVFATGGTDNLWGDAPGVRSDHQMVMPVAVAIPAGRTYLRFDHAFGFESFVGDPSSSFNGNFDGGVLEYTVDGGRTWVDAGPLMTGGNGYGVNAPATGSTRIDSRFSNPLRGRMAFVGQSQGYLTTRANLSALAGKTVRFRFRVGTDDQVGDVGWFVDNVRLYSCVPLLQVSTPPTTVLGPTTLTWPLNDRNRVPRVTYRFRSAPPGGVLGTYSPPRTVTTVGKLAVPLVRGGGTTCVNLLSADPVTPAAANQVRCVTVPVDDRALRASARPRVDPGAVEHGIRADAHGEHAPGRDPDAARGTWQPPCRRRPDVPWRRHRRRLRPGPTGGAAVAELGRAAGEAGLRPAGRRSHRGAGDAQGRVVRSHRRDRRARRPALTPTVRLSPLGRRSRCAAQGLDRAPLTTWRGCAP